MHPITRRRTLEWLASGTAILAGTARRLHAQTPTAAELPRIPDDKLRTLTFAKYTDFAKLNVQAIPAGPRAFVLTDPAGRIGGIVTAYLGRHETVLVDSAYPQAVPAVRSLLAQLHAPPVAYVINTHWHVDHTDGDAEWVKPVGATRPARIVAHATVRERRSRRQEIKSFGTTYPPLPEAALPQLTYDDSMTLPTPDATISLHHAHGHTDGDTIVHFPESNLVVLGDLSFGRQYPFIDAPSGGGWPALIAGIDRALTLGNRKTQFVPGHLVPTEPRSPILSRAELASYRDMLGIVDQRTRTAIARGMTLREFLDQEPLRDLEAKWLRSAAVSSAFIVTTAYLTIQRDS